MFDFADNIVNLRKNKGVTQEQLADFLGVTKASVSKWENAQSMPDIAMLPLLSNYFNVSIDDLLGYHPRLDDVQIEEIYAELAQKFAAESFEQVIAECEEKIKQYYVCYKFLYRMALLLLNHFMLSKSPQRQREILTMASDLCSLIIEKEKEQALCNDAQMVKAHILLILGKYEEVIESIEPLVNPLNSIYSGQGILIQAYQAKGELGPAEEYTQMFMLNDICGLISHSSFHLAGNAGNQEKCRKIINRAEVTMQAYNLMMINPNIVALFYIEAAKFYALYGQKELVYDMLEKYVDSINLLFGEELVLTRNDDFFDRVENVINSQPKISQPPRDKKVVFESALSVFSMPEFAGYKDDAEYKSLMKKIERIGDKL